MSPKASALRANLTISGAKKPFASYKQVSFFTYDPNMFKHDNATNKEIYWLFNCASYEWSICKYDTSPRRHIHIIYNINHIAHGNNDLYKDHQLSDD